jgi:hypothetical protein
MLLFAFALLILGTRVAYPTVPVPDSQTALPGTGANGPLPHSPLVPSDADGSISVTPSEYSWTLAPVDERVPILRATFDKGGYQLRTAAGNLIVVPFTAHNPFSMKFAITAGSGGAYFVNSGGAPELYLPRNGYLENATMNSARWQPFNTEFRPEIPVYAGIAPSWSTFTSMSWYPGMQCVGAFWTDTRYRPGGIVIPAVGLTYVVDGRHLDGWQGFSDWSAAHPTSDRIAYADPDLYRRVGDTQRLFAHRRDHR